MEKTITKVSKFRTQQCKHNEVILDPELAYVKCKLCGEKLNPLWVLSQYADSEARLFKQLEIVKREYELVKNKTKCKCEKCGGVTRIANERECSKAYWGGS